MDKALNDTSISDATYNILSEWFKRQENKTKAYKDLLQSLRNSKLNLLVEDLKENVEGDRTKSNLGKYTQHKHYLKVQH